MSLPSTRVVILGAGYAGVRAAWTLARQTEVPVEIILINTSAYHVDITSFYEVATAYLQHESKQSSETITQAVQVSLEDIFKDLSVQIIVGTVKQIKTDNRMVVLESGQAVSYDELIISLGTHVATFGIPGVVEHAFSIKTLPEALELRHHIVRQFHMARELRDQERQAALTFVVVGGGATGVEVAGELARDIKKQCQHCDIDPTHVTLYLVEAGPGLLKTVPPTFQAAAQKRLASLGFTVKLNCAVTEVEPERVHLKDGTVIPTKTVIWTGGLKVHPLLVQSGLPLEKWGVAVEPTLQVIGHPTIWAAGDAAFVKSSTVPIPATVPVAYTQGALVAQNIVHSRLDQPLESFTPHTLGAFITLGGRQAIVTVKDHWGYRGWLPWLGKHIVLLHYWLRYLSWWRAWSFWSRGELMKARND